MLFQDEASLSKDERLVSSLILLGRGESLGEAGALGVVTTVLLSLLTGVSLVLSQTYYRNYPKDLRRWKYLVAVMLLHVLAMISLSCGSFAYLMRSRSMAASYNVSTRMGAAGFCIVASVQFITQSFFSYRAFLLSRRNKLLLVVCLSLATATFGAGFTMFVLSLDFPRIDENTLLSTFVIEAGPRMAKQLKKLNSIATGWMVMTLVTDATIAASLLFCLFRTKAEFTRTQSAIHKPMLTITEAMVPPFVVCAVITGMVLGGYSKWGLVMFPLGANLYHIAVTSHLLARGKVRAILNGSTVPNWPTIYASSAPQAPRLGTPAPAIVIERQDDDSRSLSDFKEADNGSQPTLGPIVHHLEIDQRSSHARDDKH